MKSLVDDVRDPNNLIAQARTWQRHNVGDTAGFNGDLEKALRSIRVPVLYMPSATDLYFPVGDAKYERPFIKNISLHRFRHCGDTALGGPQPGGRQVHRSEFGGFSRT